MSAVQHTISPAEIAKFTEIADTWWDPTGAFRPLHKFNPERIRFIRDRLARREEEPTQEGPRRVFWS